jgi:hypothetical protein
MRHEYYQNLFDLLKDKVLEQTSIKGIEEVWTSNKLDINHLKTMDSMRYGALENIKNKNVSYYEGIEHVKHSDN